MRVDAHLDLAYNALNLGRNLTLPLEALRRQEGLSETPLVSLPSLREAGFGLVFATVFVDPRGHEGHLFEEALRQVALYLEWERQGLVRILRSGRDLKTHALAYPKDGVLGLLLLLEGAHVLPEPEALDELHARGVRMVGLTWATKNAYAGGNAEPAPLSALGEALLARMERLGMALDVSHLADTAFFPVMARFKGPVAASHANARALTPTPRHLSDEMLLALRVRDGVVGVVPFNAFLDVSWTRGMPRLPISACLAHKAYLEARLGPDRVGLGSDWDGGFGLESLPLGLEAHKDLVRLGDEAFLGGNWIRWLQTWL
ncbi:MAG: membrane dipeptidase [Thermus sp.]